MSCEICGKSTNLKSCGGCLKVNYCSREHQVTHWKDHRKWCNKGGINHSGSNLMDNGQLPSANCSENFLVNQTSENSLHDEQVNFMNQCLNSDENLSNTSNQVNETNSINSYTQNNLSISQNTNSDFNSQICPSMASLKVCDYSNSNNTSQTAYSGASSSSNSQLSNQSNQNHEFVFSDLHKYCQIILNDMNQYGFCVIDDFLQNGEAIMSEVLNLYRCGLFRAGQVVNNKANSNSKLIRGDQIIWIEGNEPICNNIGFLIRILDSIVTRCNTMSLGEFLKYKINRRTKAMIACYPGNYTKYVRHVDNPNNDGRCITSIYYLNKDYNRQRDGGVLRLFPQMNDGIVADIEPKFNRVIFFWSDRRNPHEVMPSARMRFAITVWYFDANERAKAIQKYKENSMQCPNDKDLVPF